MTHAILPAMPCIVTGACSFRSGHLKGRCRRTEGRTFGAPDGRGNQATVPPSTAESRGASQRPADTWFPGVPGRRNARSSGRHPRTGGACPGQMEIADHARMVTPGQDAGGLAGVVLALSGNSALATSSNACARSAGSGLGETRTYGCIERAPALVRAAHATVHGRSPAPASTPGAVSRGRRQPSGEAWCKRRPERTAADLSIPTQVRSAWRARQLSDATDGRHLARAHAASMVAARCDDEGPSGSTSISAARRNTPCIPFLPIMKFGPSRLIAGG